MWAETNLFLAAVKNARPAWNTQHSHSESWKSGLLEPVVNSLGLTTASTVARYARHHESL